ncbi:unnamed protein product [Linum tenue]|uniref:Pectinesterase inhibitor domain-containing protein n=1 Tax=Linum tenue TaxID=586396 RepID=A0AAV0J529_9ROSI|nr:unnamed protein product [Linum tenue]
MTKLLLTSLLLLCATISTAAAPANPRSSAAAAAAAASFIKSSCSATTYPALCVQSLLSYAPTIQRSPKQLAQAALAVSLSRAQSTRSYVRALARFEGLRPREKAAIRDCVGEIGDTVDRLGKSIREMKAMGMKAMGEKRSGPRFEWHFGNVATWVSAALTDVNTCVDGFAGKALNGRMKSGIEARFTNAAQFISNALALVNKYGGH